MQVDGYPSGARYTYSHKDHSKGFPVFFDGNGRLCRFSQPEKRRCRIA